MCKVDRKGNPGGKTWSPTSWKTGCLTLEDPPPNPFILPACQHLVSSDKSLDWGSYTGQVQGQAALDYLEGILRSQDPATSSLARDHPRQDMSGLS